MKIANFNCLLNWDPGNQKKNAIYFITTITIDEIQNIC